MERPNVEEIVEGAQNRGEEVEMLVAYALEHPRWHREVIISAKTKLTSEVDKTLASTVKDLHAISEKAYWLSVEDASPASGPDALELERLEGYDLEMAEKVISVYLGHYGLFVRDAAIEHVASHELDFMVPGLVRVIKSEVNGGKSEKRNVQLQRTSSGYQALQAVKNMETPQALKARDGLKALLGEGYGN